MEVAALKYQGSSVLAGRSPLLRLQSDERLIALTRRGNVAAFETLVARYESRLLAFCRHMLSSREDAEDILQEVMAAAYGAITADRRPINARPWLYRIARNRCLNHLRRAQPIGVDSMDIHFGDGGRSTADKVAEREAFRLLVDDIQELPESQRTALVLRELDALSYEQIAEAMETTIPSVKSLLVRARASLAEASEARLLSCEEVRIELAEVAEGLRSRPSPPVRRHVKRCEHCGTYAKEVRRTGRALAVLLPIGPLALARKLLLGKAAVGAWGHGSGVTGTVTAAGTASASTGGSLAAAGAGVGAASSSGLLTAGVTAIATKAVAGLAAAALVTAGAVEAGSGHRHHQLVTAQATLTAATPTTGFQAALRAPTVKPAHVKTTKVAKSITTKKSAAATLTTARSAVTTATQATATATTTVTSALPTSTITSPAATTIPTTTATTLSGGSPIDGNTAATTASQSQTSTATTTTSTSTAQTATTETGSFTTTTP